MWVPLFLKIKGQTSGEIKQARFLSTPEMLHLANQAMNSYLDHKTDSKY